MSLSIRLDGIWDEKGLRPNPLNGLPYSKQYTVLSLGTPGKKGWSEYPPWKDKETIIKKIHKYSIILCVLPTGVGKTVILPKLLLHYFGYKKRVLVTTPRHTTTSEAGSYAAQCLDVPLFEVDDNGEYIKNPYSKNKDMPYKPTGNKIVGYTYKAVKNKYGDAESMLLFTTDGNVKQKISKLNGDRDLSNYGGIVIDEAHERSTNIDILISLVMEIITRRPDFKVIIMSATIKETDFTDYFKRIGQGNNYTTYNVETTTNYKIDTLPILKKIDTSNIVDIVYNKINDIILDPKLPIGDILAFVTSESETEKIKRMIDKNMENYPINNKPYSIKFTAYIQPLLKDIATNKNTLKTIKPDANAPEGYHRKVIIATNAVESSVTFKDPMVYVIDTGLAFEKVYDAKNYCYQTGKYYVSQASIKQRCGRTGRNCNGYCMQLYTTEQFNKLSVFSKPKILVEEFTKELLSLIVMYSNISSAWNFINKMIEQPHKYSDNIESSYNNLLNMGLIDSSGNITKLGIVCNQFNKFDIKIAKMIIGGYYFNCMQWCIMLGAILTNLESFEKIFRKPAFMDENPNLEKIYKDAIKSKINEYGDHITLLIIFTNYISLPYNERETYAYDNNLDYSVLLKIQKDYEDLLSIVKSQNTMISNLNLFTVPQELNMFGGYHANNNNNNNNNNNVFSSIGSDSSDSEYSSEDDISNSNVFIDDSSESEDDSSEDDSSEDDSIINYKKIFSNSNSHSNSHSHSHDYRRNHKGGFQDFDTNIKLYNRNSENDRNFGYEIDNMQNNSIENENENVNVNVIGGSVHKKGKHTHKTKQDKKEKKHTYKHDAKQDDENTKLNKKRIKIMELLDLKHLTNTLPHDIKPSNNLENCILSSLFYGFSNNIACYSGNGKQYNVKFSKTKGSISSSSYDYIKTNKSPNFVIYNDFTVNKDMGKDGSKLNIVSEVSTEHFKYFINIPELKKKLINIPE